MSQQAIRRKNRFAQISNLCLQDPNISLKAKGLIALLMSFPEKWDFHETHLKQLSKDGRDSLRAALKELQDHSYLKKIQTKSNKGKFSHTVWSFDDEKLHDNDVSTVDWKPVNGKSDDGKTDDGKSDTINTYSNNTYNINTYSNLSKIDFVKQIRDRLKPDPDNNKFPTLNVRMADGSYEHYGIDNRGYLYSKDITDCPTLKKDDAFVIYERIFKYRNFNIKD